MWHYLANMAARGQCCTLYPITSKETIAWGKESPALAGNPHNSSPTACSADKLCACGWGLFCINHDSGNSALSQVANSRGFHARLMHRGSGQARATPRRSRVGMRRGQSLWGATTHHRHSQEVLNRDTGHRLPVRQHSSRCGQQLAREALPGAEFTVSCGSSGSQSTWACTNEGTGKARCRWGRLPFRGVPEGLRRPSAEWQALRLHTSTRS